MARFVHVHRQLIGEPKRLKDILVVDTHALLQMAAGDAVTAPAGDGSFLITMREHEAGVDAHKTVRVHLGEAVESDGWVRIPIRWEADPARFLFPSFDGGLEIEDLSANRADLVISGRYRPPLGPIGLATDPLLGGGARRAVARLLHSLGDVMTDVAYGQEPLPSVVLRSGAVSVGEIMSADLLTIPHDMSLRSAAHLMLVAGISGAPVVADGRVVGVLSEQDLLPKIAPPAYGFGSAAREQQERHDALTAGEACSRPPRLTDVDARVRDVAEEMLRHDVARLVVMRGATLAGIVTRADVLRALVRDDREIDKAIEGSVQAWAEADADHADALSWEVDDGVVTVRGTLARRSHVPALLGAIESVVGVVQVRSPDLAWEEDDVVVPPLM